MMTAFKKPTKSREGDIQFDYGSLKRFFLDTYTINSSTTSSLADHDIRKVQPQTGLPSPRPLHIPQWELCG